MPTIRGTNIRACRQNARGKVYLPAAALEMKSNKEISRNNTSQMSPKGNKSEERINIFIYIYLYVVRVQSKGKPRLLWNNNVF